MLQLRNLSKKGVFSLKNTMKLFCIIAIVVIIGFSTASCIDSGGDIGNSKWEYTMFNGRGNSESDREELINKLNGYGSQGWELVSSGLSYISSPGGNGDLYFILKRKL